MDERVSLEGCSHKRLKKSKKFKKKRDRHTSSETSSVSDSSLSSEEKKHRAKKHKKKKLKEKLKKQKKKSKAKDEEGSENECVIGPAIPNNLVEQSRRMAPETREEWEKRQNVIKRVYDEQTGRYRLVKGDGEVLEEIVSKDRHKEINKQATLGDNQYFQSKLNQSKMN